MMDVSIKKFDKGYLVTGSSLEVTYKDHYVGIYHERLRMYETRTGSFEKFFHNKEQASFLAHKLVTDAFDAQRQCNVLNKKEEDKREKMLANSRTQRHEEEREAQHKVIEQERAMKDLRKTLIDEAEVEIKEKRSWGWWT